MNPNKNIIKALDKGMRWLALLPPILQNEPLKIQIESLVMLDMVFLKYGVNEFSTEREELRGKVKEGNIEESLRIASELSAKLGRRMEELSSHLRVAAEIKCIHCGSVILKDSKFCSQCSKPQTKIDEASSHLSLAMEVQCPKCGSRNLKDAKYCKTCGKLFGS